MNIDEAIGYYTMEKAQAMAKLKEVKDRPECSPAQLQ